MMRRHYLLRHITLYLIILPSLLRHIDMPFTLTLIIDISDYAIICWRCHWCQRCHVGFLMLYFLFTLLFSLPCHMLSPCCCRAIYLFIFAAYFRRFSEPRHWYFRLSSFSPFAAFDYAASPSFLRHAGFDAEAAFITCRLLLLPLIYFLSFAAAFLIFDYWYDYYYTYHYHYFITPLIFIFSLPADIRLCFRYAAAFRCFRYA